MTIATTSPKSRYDGDDVTGHFPTGFKFIDNAHVRVILQAANGSESLWTEGSEYSLSGAGAPGGGTVTVATSPTDYRPQNGETLVIKLAIPPNQQTSLPLGGAFPSTAVEGMADLAALRDQQLEEALSRALKFKETTAFSDVEFPEASAGKPIAWNEAGDGLENRERIGKWQGDWATATAYEALDIVRVTPGNDVYVCELAHTSGVFATDLAANRWSLAINVQDVETAKAAAQTAATNAANSASAASTSETNATNSAAAAATSETNAATFAQLNTTSTSSIAIGTGTRALVTADDRAFVVGQFVQVARTAAPTSQYMWGQVINWDDTSNTLTLDIQVTQGSGTFAAWTISGTGARGEQGPQGDQGSTGATGETGATGPEGPQGVPGDQGLAGPAGAAGKTVLNGSGAPGGGTGVDGDFYIDTAANAIYGPKTSGAWGSATNLVGPQGETGAAGQQGPQGIPGDQGPAGAAGAAGKTVLNGSGAPGGGTGVDGDFYIDTAADAIYGPKTSGAWGSATNLVGPKGDPGAQGDSGAQGNPGADGRTVLSGSGDPSGGVGAEGDFYIDTTANAIYGPKTSGAWGSATNLVGPQGDPGTGVVPQGAYLAGTSYALNDGVIYAGSFWRSLQNANQGNTPDSSPTFWEQMVAKGDTGPAGSIGSAADGSVSAPSFAFASDLDTGFYRVGTDTVGIAAGGISAATFAEAGATITVTLNGDLAVTGTVDGRDVAADGTKLDSFQVSGGIEILTQTAYDLLSPPDANTLYFING